MTEVRPAPSELDDLEFRPGDIVRPTHYPDPSLRYRVRESERGWVALQRIRKDGRPDRREHGFSGSPKGFALAERPEGLRYVRHGNVWHYEEPK